MSQERSNNVGYVEQDAFAVFRNGQRVSDSVYHDAFFAQRELDYWKGIVRKWPDGSRIEVRKLRPRAPRQEQKTQDDQQ